MFTFRMQSWKKAVVGILALVMCFSMVGCGSSKKSTKGTQTAGEEYAYRTTIHSVEKSDFGYYSNYAFSGGYLYYTENTWSEEDDSRKVIVVRMDPVSGSTEEYSLDALSAEVQAMCVDQEGNYHFACNNIEYDEDWNVVRTECYILIMDPAGQELGRIDCSSLRDSEEEPVYVNGMVMDQNGMYYLNLDSSIAAVNEEGVSFTISVTDYIYGMGITREGDPIICYYGQGPDGWTMQGHLIDTEGKKLGATYDNFPNMSGNGYIGAGIETDILIPTENGLVGYNCEDGSRQEYLNYIDSDLMISDLRFSHMLENGDIVLVNEDYSSDILEVIYCERVAADSVVKVNTLTLGGMYFSDDIKRHVVEFNRENDEYSIKLIEYLTDDVEYEDAEANMNNAIASGNGADMYVITDVGMGNKYASKGLFLDLNSYLDQDPDLDLEDYYENILKCYSYGDMCYGLVPKFILQSYVGRQSNLGDRTEWTTQDVMELMQEHPDMVFCPYLRKETLLYMLVCNDIDHYVNWSTGQCSFDTEMFMDVLKFVDMAVPAEEREYSEEEDRLFYENKALVSDAYVTSLEEIQLYTRMIEEPLVFIGMPTSSGGGNRVIPEVEPIAISSKCKYPDVAWEFIRYFLLPEFQNMEDNWGAYGFPVLRSAMDQYIAEAMTPETYTNENGEEVEVTSTWGINGIDVEIGAVTSEERDILFQMMENCQVAGGYDNKIIEILSEEVSAYFKGSKSAEETAKIIQSRISIYVNENM